MRTGTRAALAVITGALTTTATFLVTAALSPVPTPARPTLQPPRPHCAAGHGTWHPTKRTCRRDPAGRARRLSPVQP
ncbi:hypothetical protein [Nonomuraea jabiensis]|uniref:Secreted protein n=1 Tax=Nonomuraea jabiensis TaxID=882448 RepID=A0A7W9GFI4_9ACTN|nr:hypothetical protein [Nonomuraea jabiensis]MBB5782844.1 hypothetical protein [Nonomuraea jabiensis]